MNYSFAQFVGLFWIFVYVWAAQTSACQAGPKFKTVRQRVWKNNSRDFKKIWLSTLGQDLYLLSFVPIFARTEWNFTFYIIVQSDHHFLQVGNGSGIVQTAAACLSTKFGSLKDFIAIQHGDKVRDLFVIQLHTFEIIWRNSTDIGSQILHLNGKMLEPL